MRERRAAAMPDRCRCTASVVGVGGLFFVVLPSMVVSDDACRLRLIVVECCFEREPLLIRPGVYAGLKRVPARFRKFGVQNSASWRGETKIARPPRSPAEHHEPSLKPPTLNESVCRPVRRALRCCRSHGRIKLNAGSGRAEETAPRRVMSKQPGSDGSSGRHLHQASTARPMACSKK